MTGITNLEGKVAWQKIVAPYARPDLSRSIWQIVNTLVPYFVLFYLALRSVDISFWLTLPLTVLAAGFMIRAFIIFHDCGHGSFFKSPRANEVVGFVTGLLAFTPYHRWRHQHAIHHATSGDLDRRGVGDVYTMTVQEYLEAPWWKKAGYRIMRNPVAMFLVGPVFLFLIVERIPPAKGKREIASVWWTNLALVLIVTAMILTFGWKAYLTVQLLVLFFGTSVGVWLFYVQHNFEGVYWERHPQWDYFKASMQGSSFYRLPGAAAVVHRQYRVPPHSSPGCKDPQLQPGQGLPGEHDLPRPAADPALQPAMPQMASVRRSQPAAGRLGGAPPVPANTHRSLSIQILGKAHEKRRWFVCRA